MRFVTFDPYTTGTSEGRFHVNPESVASVLEKAVYPNGYYTQLAVIELKTGEKYAVLDPDRTVAEQLCHAPELEEST